MKRYYRPECKGCIYWRRLSGYETGNLACHYMLDNNKPRKRAKDGSCLSRCYEKTGKGRRDWPIAAPWAIPSDDYTKKR